MTNMHGRLALLALLLGAGLSALTTPTSAAWEAAWGDDPAYEAEVQAWRDKREADLKADDGWLVVAGLYFLRDGINTFGASPLNDIVLPAGVPDTIGVFEYSEGTTIVRAAEGTSLTVNGEAVREARLQHRSGDRPADEITVGTQTIFVHISGARHAIRVRDTNNPIRRDFAGLNWYPVREEYRVEGTFTPYDQPKPVDLPNILGDIEHYASPGVVSFTLEDREFQLEPVSSGGLWFVFRDLTAGEETYPATRYLRASEPKDGKVVLDFNKAYNPPCAFNPYTTCALPAPMNRLPVRIEAGELDYGRH